MNLVETLRRNGVDLRELRHHKVSSLVTAVASVALLILASERLIEPSSSATTQDGQPTPAPLVTPEPTPAPTPEIHIPDSQFIAVAEKALSQPYVAGQLSLREYQRNFGSVIEALEENSGVAEAGIDGLIVRTTPIAHFMDKYIPNPRIRAGEKVTGIAEVKTQNPDGSKDVFWLLKPPDDHKNALQLYLPEYVRIKRVFPDGSEELYVNNIQFTKPAR